jgi:hypothetical protein
MPHLSPRALHERAVEDFATHTDCPPVIVRTHRSLSGDILATAHNAPDSDAFYSSSRSLAAPATVDIHLDDLVLRRADGVELARHTTEGWITAQGLPTSCVRVALSAPAALVNPVELERHRAREAAAWQQHAIERLESLAAELREFTVDDVTAAIELEPHDARAQMAALMAAGERRGLMSRTENTRPSRRIRRPVRVWRSLIYEPDADR